MTRCPACGRRDDAGALFCPADGTALVADGGGPPPGEAAPRETASGAPTPGDALSASGELDRLLSLPDAAPVPALPPAVPPEVSPAAAAPRRLGGVVAVLVALVVGMGALVLWQQRTAAAAAEVRASTAEAEAASARRDAGAQAEAAQIERDASDAADAARADAERQQAAARAFDAGYTATVWANSPGDGFLALRSGPTTASGTRLLKIPHGDALALGGCLEPTTSPDGRYGAWCRARYAGTDGWVFDAFVSR